MDQGILHFQAKFNLKMFILAKLKNKKQALEGKPAEHCITPIKLWFRHMHQQIYWLILHSFHRILHLLYQTAF